MPTWSRKTLDELEATYRDDIAPALRQAGHDPTTPPSYETLTNLGYSGIAYALREHHDLTLREFFVDVVGLADETSDPWGLATDDVRAELQAYVDTLADRRGLAATTVRTKRSRLARYARTYESLHEGSLVERVRTRDTRVAEIERALAVFDELDRDLESDAAKLRYLGDVQSFYSHLMRRGKAAYSPVDSLGAEFDWERERPDNPALDADQVGRIYRAADSSTERLTVLSLCAWGLRRSEAARLHTEHLALDGDDPHLAFDERKNGPGTVALLYGRDALTAHLQMLADDESWAGSVFPSPASSRDHVSGETVNDRFQRVAARAGVTLRGETPTSKAGRRFWYGAYDDAVAELVGRLDYVAGEQGSADPTVVMQNYLSEDERRRRLRDRMRDRLSAAFEAR